MTKLSVIINRPQAERKHETVLQLFHRDFCASGPTVGPLTVSVGAVYVWLGRPGQGEPVSIGPGESVLITCEEEQG